MTYIKLAKTLRGGGNTCPNSSKRRQAVKNISIVNTTVTVVNAGVVCKTN